MPINPDHMKLYSLRPVRAMQFDPSKPRSEWPEGVVEYKPRNYALWVRDRQLHLSEGDWIIYAGLNTMTMTDNEFQTLYEERSPAPSNFVLRRR